MHGRKWLQEPNVSLPEGHRDGLPEAKARGGSPTDREIGLREDQADHQECPLEGSPHA